MQSVQSKSKRSHFFCARSEHSWKCGKKRKHNNKYHGYTIYLYICMKRHSEKKTTQTHAGWYSSSKRKCYGWFSIFNLLRASMKFSCCCHAQFYFCRYNTTTSLLLVRFRFELCIRRSKVSQKKINCQLLFILLLTLHYLLDLMSGGTTTVNIFSLVGHFVSCFFSFLFPTFVFFLYVHRIFISF